MPPLYDAMDLANALRDDALPALQALEDRPHLRERDLRRFEDDDPPPYESSTEYGLSQEDRAMFDAPLTEAERQPVASSMQYPYLAETRYALEESVQRERVNSWARCHSNPEVRRLLCPIGSGEKISLAERRCAVISRHIIKRRWQKLGVWNPKWGIPEPFTDGSSSPYRKDRIGGWAWQHDDTPGALWDKKDFDPLRRAVELRQGLRFGEHAPVQPRSHLTASASKSQAEAFITSRPWFQLSVEMVERSKRLLRIDDWGRQRRDNSNIIQNWKDRGDWQDKWNATALGRHVVGWKWRHESPSPEPDDLSGVQTMAGLELTPSETDAFEKIPNAPPTPPPRSPSPIDLTEVPTNPFTRMMQNMRRAQLAAEAAAAAGEAADDGNGDGDVANLPQPDDEHPGGDQPPHPSLPQPAPTRASRRKKAMPPPEEPPRPLRRSARIAALAARQPPAPVKPQPTRQTRGGKGQQSAKQAATADKNRSKQKELRASESGNPRRSVGVDG
ncbi:hypothetical protein HMPREF1624_04593 [Sporothrix schenckii ATCC 58251]|uniref:Uncharacterized protein n=1 Tax=Sporothrix schenckii (strain ATCC 58251 / de Perez 2211183) TaxID=1391915 RepID=U7PUV6_SPOS1|nr:hypothetical protein HMPREF1624_04593 [Sporothrix schenckii ATCC 58251]